MTHICVGNLTIIGPDNDLSHCIVSEHYANRLNQQKTLTQWGRVTHMCVGNLTIIGPDNDLSHCIVSEHYANRLNQQKTLTQWGRVTHICVGNITITGPDNGLSPARRQDIIWTNAGILFIGLLGTNFSEIFIGFKIFSFKKRHLKMSSEKWHPFCLCVNVLSDGMIYVTVKQII